MPHLDINTLGAFQVRLDGHSLAFRTDKIRALLVFLVVEAARPYRREALATMFWADRPVATARNNLRQALYHLREVLGDQRPGSTFLLTTPNEIQFDPGSDYRLDVVEFSAHLAACQAHHPGRLSICASFLGDLRSAAALYGGDFLAGFSLPGCPQFEWWLLNQQELYHRQILETLARLGAYYERIGDYHQVSFFAQKEIELEPWRETAHRRRMRALALSGERSQALRQYESCRAILAQEMGIEPSKGTMKLFELIRAGDTLPVAGAQPQLSVPSLSLPTSFSQSPSAAPFVGFENELAQLERQLAAVLSGRARVAFIAGEAGSGKTTLLAEFIRRALDAQGDLLAAVGDCSTQFAYGDPYLPFRHVLHALTGDLDNMRFAGVPGEEYARRIWAALPFVLETIIKDGSELVDILLPSETLARITHNLGDQGAEALVKLQAIEAQRKGELSTGGPQFNQKAFFDQLTQSLFAITCRFPLILALDDLQWADRGSLSLFFHLARNLRNARVLLLGVYRPEEIAWDHNGERHPMQTLVNELLAQFGEIRVDLSKASGWDFVNALLDSEPNNLGADFRQALFQLTEGQPLFTVEQVREMQESGGLVQDKTGHWITAEGVDWERISSRVEAVITERLARPAPNCRPLLEAASVQGETFCAETLAGVLNESEAQVIERLSSELCRQHRLVFAEGVQRFGDVTCSRYRFRHALYQRQLYQNLDPVLRSRLHLTTGEALERRFTGQSGCLTLDDGSAPRLAFHFEKAGLPEKAVQYHQEAGQHAYRLAANEDAISHYNRALELLKSMPESQEKNRQELLILTNLSAALNAARGYAEPELRRLFTRAGNLAAESGEIDLISQSLYLKGTYHHVLGEFQNTLDTGEQLLELSLDQSIPWVSDIANFVLGIGRLNIGDISLAQAHLQKINAHVDSEKVNYTASPADRARLLFPVFLTWTLWLLGYPDQALNVNQQLLSKVGKLGYPYILAFVQGTSSCVVRTFRREFKHLRNQTQKLIDLSTDKGFDLYLAWGMIFLGRAQVEMGNIEVGLANLQAGLNDFRATDQKCFLTFIQAIQAEAFATAGRNDEGLKTLSGALAMADKTGERFFEAELHRLKGELLLASSAGGDEVESCFLKALKIAQEQEAKSLELRAASSLAQLWARQGKTHQARQILVKAYNWFSEGFEIPDLQKARAMIEELAERSSIGQQIRF